MTRFRLQSEIQKSVPLAVVVFLGEKGPAWSRTAKSFSPSLLKKAAEDGFRGDTGTRLLLRTEGAPADRLLLLGGGDPSEFNSNVLRKTAAAAAAWAESAGAASLAFLLPRESDSTDGEVQTAVEGFLLGQYRFDRHKSRPGKPPALREARLIAPKTAGQAEALSRGEIFPRAVNTARDLINEPPSLKTPETLGRFAAGLAGRGIKARVFKKTDLKRMGMFALLGVNRGSAHPPVLVHLKYTPARRPKKRVAIVGKGITFDSGGLSLKTADGMMRMKYDMAGAAVVLGLFQALARLRPDLEVHGLAPITENMPGQDAYKPGDVVKTYGGKTIEVLNTDAEGRVVLSDALSYAARLGVDEIIDLATLTGAASIALGKAYAALMANDDALAERLRKASEKSGEKVWRLPLEPSYKSHIKSSVADLKNIGNPGEAGTIIGGLFLSEFVGKTPWAHLDIASCAWAEKDAALGAPGGTGVMVRTLLQYLMEG